jgi:hypothetical protein
MAGPCRLNVVLATSVALSCGCLAFSRPPPLPGPPAPGDLVVEDGGRVRRARPQPTPDGVYAAYRDGKPEEFVRVHGIDAPAQRVTPLACCYAPRAGDALVSRPRAAATELVPTFSASALTWNGDARFAPGFGFRGRVSPFGSGLYVGVAVETLFASGASAGLFTAEGGYRWRPAPSLTVGFIAGAGAGFSAASAAGAPDSPARAGAHGLLAAVALWQPLRPIFLTVDAGYIHSQRFGSSPQPAVEVRGPLLRLALGFR